MDEMKVKFTDYGCQVSKYREGKLVYCKSFNRDDENEVMKPLKTNKENEKQKHELNHMSGEVQKEYFEYLYITRDHDKAMEEIYKKYKEYKSPYVEGTYWRCIKDYTVQGEDKPTFEKGDIIHYSGLYIASDYSTLDLFGFEEIGANISHNIKPTLLEHFESITEKEYNKHKEFIEDYNYNGN